MTVTVTDYDPRPHDQDRYLDAIARRNSAWAAWREALRRLEAIRVSDPRPFVRDVNDTQQEYEHAAKDLARARVRWLAEARR